ncbi:MAG TPA: glycosyltransferase family 1 protein [Polyangia bacterium]|nr:glycosyltransferase family 1 protein [Polyangia bacterium]
MPVNSPGADSTSGAAPPLHVAVLHNYRDEQQPSMRLYAERLGSALLRHNVRITRVRPPGVVPATWRSQSAAWNKLDGYIGRFAVYPRLVRDLRADVIHVVDHGQGYLVAGLEGGRTVVTCHDVILLALAAGRIGSARVPQVALQLFRISLEAMKRAAAVVAVSQQTKRDLVDLVQIDPRRVVVIHSGLNQTFVPDRARGRALRERMGLGQGIVILQIGRAFYKNLPAVLRVLHRLRKGGIDARVARVGPPVSEGDRQLAEQLGVFSSVIELGPIADRDLPALYNAVDLLLFPSIYEGFGWPPLEAMASGTPVVCSRAGSLEEIVSDAALTADPEDDETLAWHVAAVLTDERARAALVERGLAHAAQFTWDRTAEQMIGVYRDVLAQTG